MFFWYFHFMLVVSVLQLNSFSFNFMPYMPIKITIKTIVGAIRNFFPSSSLYIDFKTILLGNFTILFLKWNWMSNVALIAWFPAMILAYLLILKLFRDANQFQFLMENEINLLWLSCRRVSGFLYFTLDCIEWVEFSVARNIFDATDKMCNRSINFLNKQMRAWT